MKMTANKNVMVDIQNDIIVGILSFKSIAEKHNVPFSWVNVAWDVLCEQENEDFDGLVTSLEDME
jgi:hypothetical protein